MCFTKAAVLKDPWEVMKLGAMSELDGGLNSSLPRALTRPLTTVWQQCGITVIWFSVMDFALPLLQIRLASSVYLLSKVIDHTSMS